MAGRRMKDGRYGKVYKNILTKEYLDREYTQNKKSAYKIAEEVGCSAKVVYNYLDFHKIPKIKFNGEIESSQEFGWLTTIEKIGKTKNGTYIWKCNCVCGKIVEATTVMLKNGRTKSCGCYRKRKKNHRWKGFCDISGAFVSSIKYRAKKKKIEFDLDAEFLWNLLQEQESLCAISGIELSLDNNASVDRIDSNKGYTKDNVQWVDSRINVMKNDLSLNDFIYYCKQVIENQKGD